MNLLIQKMGRLNSEICRHKLLKEFLANTHIQTKSDKDLLQNFWQSFVNFQDI